MCVPGTLPSNESAPPLAPAVRLGQSVHSVHPSNGPRMTDADLDEHHDLAALHAKGFSCAKRFGPNHWGALIQQGSFHAVVDGDRAALGRGFQNHWQYLSFHGALKALRAWDGEAQPKGFIGARLNQAMTVWP